MARKTEEPKARVSDYIRKDGELVKVMEVREEAGEWVYYTSDGGCIGDDEVSDDDVLLESEGFDEFHRSKG